MLSNNLDIYKKSMDLASTIIDVSQKLPHDLKEVLGNQLMADSFEIFRYILKANRYKQKRVRYLEELINNMEKLCALIRICDMKHYIGKKQMASLIKLTTQISKEAIGWKKSSEKSDELE